MRKDLRKGDRHKPRTGDRHKPRTGDRHKNDRNPITRRIIAVDGEGWGLDSENRQRYMLMVAADKDGLVNSLYTGDHIDTHSALSFLYNLPHTAHITSYVFNYDIAMFLRDLPREKLLELQRRDKRPVTKTGQPHLVYWQGWGLDWLPGKFFSISRHTYGETGTGSRNTQIIYDASPFHQRSYLATLNSFHIATDEEMEIITAGKARRGIDDDQWNPAGDDERAKEELVYSTAECSTLARIQAEVFRLCRETGYPLRSYYGAGSVASAMFLKHGIKEFMSPVDQPWRTKTFDNAVACAYFGGRFETVGHGHVEHSYQYDIRSAYPAAATTLPCLAHMNIRRAKKTELQPPFAEGLYHVQWWSSGMWGPLPIRDLGGDPLWPRHGKNYIYASELNAALPLLDHYDVLDGWVFERQCDHEPFGWLTDVYEQRKILKEAKDGREKILKLGPNAVYGKLAQTVGNPRYAEPIWAGMITAFTRGLLLSAICQNPNAIVSTATDAVISTEPLNLDCRNMLGAWEMNELRPLLIVQPGVYFTYDGEVVKRRGVPKIPKEAIIKLWWEKYAEGKVVILFTKIQMFVTIGQGCASDKVKTGQWIHRDRMIMFISKKRRGLKVTRKGWHSTYPHSGYNHDGFTIKSQPYKLNTEEGFLDDLNTDDIYEDFDEKLSRVQVIE